MMDLLNLRDEDNKIAFAKDMLHLDIMGEIENLMGDMNRAELAQKLNTSPAFVSKLFRGNNTINLELMAKIQRIFNAKFSIKLEPVIHSKTISLNALPMNNTINDKRQIQTVLLPSSVNVAA